MPLSRDVQPEVKVTVQKPEVNLGKPQTLAELSEAVGEPGKLESLKKGVKKDWVAIAVLMGIAMMGGKFGETLNTGKKEKKDKKAKRKPSAKAISPAVAVSVKDKKEKDKSEDKLEDKKKSEVKPEVAAVSAEVQKSSELVIIGDSIPKGMVTKFKRGERPDFIGAKGQSTPAILKDVKSNKEALNGKKTAIISCGINDLVGTDNYEKVVGNIEKMVKECEDAGIHEIIVLTGFPFQSGSEKIQLRNRSKALREIVLKRFHEPRVKVVDLYKHFADKDGNLKEQYATKNRNNIHPYKAYKDALKVIGRRSRTNFESIIG